MTVNAVPAPKPAPRLFKPPVVAGVAIDLLLAAAVALHPNLSLLFAASPVIQIHVYAAVLALLLGTALMGWRKGRTFHRAGGWTFCLLMLTVAGASLFITEINPGHWSWIHILSGLTLVTVPLGVFYARSHNVKRHRGTMTSIYFGGLIIAGAFTFVPGRLMFRIFFGH